MDLDVLYLDNHVLVINKPPGLLAQGDHTGDPTVLSLGKTFLKEHFDKPGRVYLGLMHRLDRPASGVMVLARTSKAARRLTDQFRQRHPEKGYLAVAEGRCQGEGVCDDFLVKERRQVRVVAEDYPKAKRARLRWRLVAFRDELSLLDLRLETGRPHQVRVQLAHRGHPLLGDIRYGARRELDGRTLALHAYRLTLDHPTRRESMTWTAPPPSTWHGLFDAEIEAVLNKTGMDYEIILETDRLFLRRLTPDDASLICDLDSDPEVMRYISKGQPTPLEKIENEVLPRWLRLYEKHEHLGFFAAHENTSGDFIGWLCLQPDRYIPEIEIGYRLKRHVWGRGYATEGSKALVEKAFTAWGLDRITSHTLAVNKASQRVMEKCGLRFQHSFTYEASLLPGWTEEQRQGVRYGLSKGDYLRMKEGESF